MLGTRYAIWGSLAVVAAAACGEPFTNSSGSGGGGASSSTGNAGAPPCADDLDCVALKDDCNAGRCVGGRCDRVAANEGMGCDDGSLCTSNDRCMAGSCMGDARSCPPAAAPCLVSACDGASGDCIEQPAPDGTTCEDGEACTHLDQCVAGVCEGMTPGCGDADGCCPEGCTSDIDADCVCTVNLALGATASFSGGGTNQFGAQAMNDGLTQADGCTFAWITNSSMPSGAWIQYQWPAPVTAQSIYIDTQPASSTICAAAGRNVKSGVVQAWSGASWIQVATFSGENDDVQLTFAPVVTDRLRVYDVTAEGSNSMIFEWYVFRDPGCGP